MAPVEEKELTFLDLVVLQRIGPDTTIERFGSKINSSFFDAANILGTINIKGYVTIESAIGASKVTVSESGRSVLAMAEEKSREEIDALDKGILSAVSQGIKDLDRLREKLNVRSGDLAYHLYKLVKNNYIDYDIRSGKVTVMLTESGFKNMGPVQEEAPKETIGAEIAQENKGTEFVEQKREKPPSVGTERAKTKTMFYLKKWGKYASIALIAIIILLIVFIYFYLQSSK